MIYIIAYDITDDRRRSRVAQYLEGWGRRVQKSVFECDLSADELREVRRVLEDLLDSSVDCCLLYRVCAECFPRKVLVGTEIESPVEGALVV